MRRFTLLIVLALVAAGHPAAAQEPGLDQPKDEPVLEEMPGKLMVTVDTGGHTSPVTQLLFTPDSKEVITTSSDKTIRIWDLASGQTTRACARPAPLVRRARFTPPPCRRTARRGNRHRLTGKGEGLAQAVWSADGQRVAWTGKLPAKGAEPVFPRSFHLTDLELGPEVRKDFQGIQHTRGDLTLQHNGGRVELLKDGKRVYTLAPYHCSYSTLLANDYAALSGDGNEGHLVLRSTSTGKELRDLRGHTAVVTSLATAPSGRYLLSSGADQTLHIWDPEQDKVLPPRKPIYPLLSLLFAGNDWVVWTQEGYYAASPGGERLVGWTAENGPAKLATFYPAERFRKKLYRPDVIQLVLDKGSVAEALKAADALRGQASAPANLEKLLPPRASLQVLDQKDAPKVKVKAAAVAAVPEQPVTVLRLLVDGRPLPNSQGLLDLKAGQPKAEAEWTIELPPGKHQLAVLARGPDASGVSETIEVSAPLPEKDRPVLHVLPIGIDAYQDPALKLEAAAADARAIAAAFKRSCAGPGNLFREAKGEPLINEKATRANVLAALRELRQRVKVDDLAVVFFAGHGVKEKDQFYLLTVEADTKDLARTALSGDDLRKALGEFPCQVLLMLDACHSAAGLKVFRPATDDLTRTLTDDEVGVAVLCAAMGHEKALERQGNGLFTRAVMAGLSDSQRVPYNSYNHRQYVHHLYAYVSDRVTAESENRQHPFLSLPWVVEPFALRQLPPKSPGQR